MLTRLCVQMCIATPLYYVSVCACVSAYNYVYACVSVCMCVCKAYYYMMLAATYFYYAYAVAPFVPRDFVPVSIDRTYAQIHVTLICPFINAGNPPPVCTWRRLDNRNISHQISLNYPLSVNLTCAIMIIFGEDDNGLYQCTGQNIIGNATYTFPKRFIVESKLCYSHTCSIITPHM